MSKSPETADKESKKRWGRNAFILGALAVGAIALF